MRLVVLLLLAPVILFAQSVQPSASEIMLSLKKLNFLGSALYVAAHPDDENTRVITWLANERLATSAYLSMTRGDGGQNLIGSEIRDQLGLIRTQELITARKIDGGEQFFTRANDFGYSKSADETLEIWDKEEILSDVVRIYRAFQPDIVITRFPPDERAGHGHHTASAMLAQEAFDLSELTTAYPDQLTTLPVWRPIRVYTNTGRFFSNTIDENTPGITTLNVGGYNALLGASYAEIAAASRSQHKSQGFGASGRRGDAQEFFELVKGEPATEDIFDGVNTTWSRVKGGNIVQPLVEKAIREFDVERPYRTVPLLLQVRKAIMHVEPGVWKERKLQEVEQLIKDCTGLFVEVVSSSYYASPGQKLILNYEIINRSQTEIVVQRLTSSTLMLDTTFTATLKNNAPLTFKSAKIIHSEKSYSDPYWLREPHELGRFSVSDKSLIGKPENDPAVVVAVQVAVNGEKLTFAVPVIYKWTDPVKGELYRPFDIVPPVFVNLTDPVLIFKDNAPRQINVLVKSSADLVKGDLSLQLPEGWLSEPSSVSISLNKRGEEFTQSFTIYPTSSEMIGIVKAVMTIGDIGYDYALQTIKYDHIPIQTLLPKAEARLVRVNIKREGNTIGYIKGAGDDIPVALRNMGYDVLEFKNGEVTTANLAKLDAVVLGIRAFNTNERLRFLMPELLNYVKKGGTLVIQYNTNFDLGSTYSPYPLKISRQRVAEEDAEVRILKPNHPALNFPNKITSADFEGWVQERGLYFPDTWDQNFEALLSMNDKGEKPKDGSLLIANYGDGHYVYTGLSFFRELPEGVPGAYKLFANLVSLGKKPVEAPATSGNCTKKNKKKK